MASKIEKGDAQEMLSALQLSGEGWYRQCALGVKLGAPKALGMTDREFARSIGQRLVDSREAIVELFDEGHSQARITAVLSVSHQTVHDVLIDAGRIEGEKSKVHPGERTRRKALGGTAGPTSEGEGAVAGDASEGEGAVAGDASEDKARADKLERDLKQAEQKARRLAESEAEAKAKLVEFETSQKDMARLVREKVEAARKEAEGEVTEQERKRLRKEAEAWAEEKAQQMVSGFRKQTVGHVVEAITEATDDLASLLSDGGVDGGDMEKISTATAALNEQVSIARASVTVAAEEGSQQ